jgi:hypothetical protein
MRKCSAMAYSLLAVSLLVEVCLASSEVKKRMIGMGLKRPSTVGSSSMSGSALGSRRLSPASSQSIFDDNKFGKNDDAHLRLFYKSNAPGQTVSHELEHRFVKNPNFQYNERLRQDVLNNNDLSSNPNRYSPYLSAQQPLVYSLNSPAVYSDDLDANSNNNNNNLNSRDKQTTLNLHYHGNSLTDPQGKLIQDVNLLFFYQVSIFIAF